MITGVWILNISTPSSCYILETKPYQNKGKHHTDAVKYIVAKMLSTEGLENYYSVTYDYVEGIVSVLVYVDSYSL